MSAFTLQSAKDSFEREKQDISDISDELFVEWCQFIVDFMYEQLTAEDPEQLVVTQDYNSVTSGAQDLPDDFLSLNEYGTGFFEKDENGNMTDIRLPMTGPGSQSRGFYLTGSSVVFTGIEAAESFVCRYTPTAPVFDADNITTEYITSDKTSSGKIIIDSRFKNFLNKALDVHYEKWDQNTSAEVAADQRFIRAMDHILRKFRRTSTVFAIPDYSSMY